MNKDVEEMKMAVTLEIIKALAGCEWIIILVASVGIALTSNDKDKVRTALLWGILCELCFISAKM